VEVNVTMREEAVVIGVTGEVTTREDQRALTGLVTAKLAEGGRKFVVDLSGVPYVSSIGIAALVAMCVKVKRDGGTLRLVNPSPRVAHVLEVTRVTDIFQTYSSVDEALGAA